MKQLFHSTILLFSFLTFCFNPIVVLAQETISQSSSQPVEQTNSQSDESSKQTKKAQETTIPINNKHKYRPKTYRRLMGGVLFAASAGVIISCVMVGLQGLGIIATSTNLIWVVCSGFCLALPVLGLAFGLILMQS